MRFANKRDCMLSVDTKEDNEAVASGPSSEVPFPPFRAFAPLAYLI